VSPAMKLLKKSSLKQKQKTKVVCKFHSIMYNKTE